MNLNDSNRLKTPLRNKWFKKISVKSNHLLILLAMLCFSLASFGQDATGASTGTIKDLGIDTIAKSPLPADSTLNNVVATVNTIGNTDGHNKIAINIVWTLITGFLVM